MDKLEKFKKTETALEVSGSNSNAVAGMLEKVIAGGVTTESVGALEKLTSLYERMADRDAEKQFAIAFMELQSEIPKIKATKVIPNKTGGVRSTFAPFEEIDNHARAICRQHGFMYSFDEGEPRPGYVTKICTLQHVGGHKKRNSYSVRIGSGPPGCSEAQADGSAHSYAKRGALCDCLNIVVTGIDNDANPRLEGAPITPEQAASLRERVRSTGSSEDMFLQYAGARTYEEIAASKYSLLDASLRKKESTK